MAKVVGLAYAIIFLVLPVNPQNAQFSKYKRVET